MVALTAEMQLYIGIDQVLRSSIMPEEPPSDLLATPYTRPHLAAMAFIDAMLLPPAPLQMVPESLISNLINRNQMYPNGIYQCL